MLVSLCTLGSSEGLTLGSSPALTLANPTASPFSTSYVLSLPLTCVDARACGTREHQHTHCTREGASPCAQETKRAHERGGERERREREREKVCVGGGATEQGRA